MRHTTVFGRGGRRRLSRWYFPALSGGGTAAPAIRTIRDLAWAVGGAATRALQGALRSRLSFRPRPRPLFGDRRP